jgi:hypothetical protein
MRSPSFALMLSELLPKTRVGLILRDFGLEHVGSLAAKEPRLPGKPALTLLKTTGKMSSTRK